ncbi:metallophosphoesterase family protein [Sporosarcina sp. YIM B06819]|uniref:metallophosphoesterase family protein n=1 Tax=Sporosarcina sp. YIM B06819 TaxID=3081769 RepID=UPI00298C43A4|nr:metallophosphoesterase [Sporosarcina sp. YIM B06819]
MTKPIFSFSVISDVHISEKDVGAHQKLVHALQDLQQIVPDYDAIIVNGDMINDGREESYGKLTELLDEHLQKEAFFAIGNHEFFNNDGNEAAIQRYFKFAGVDSVYYEKIMKGIPFIFLGSEGAGPMGSPTQDCAVLSETQLDWLDSRLKKHAQSAGPIFVCLHQPIPYTISGTDHPHYQQLIISHNKLVERLANYPQVVYFSGHSHWDLRIPGLFLRKQFAMVNTGGVYNTWGLDAQGNEVVIDAHGSQGLFVEVYADKVIIKGRDFAKQQWIEEFTHTIIVNEQKN